jgi:hypothetical protein
VHTHTCCGSGRKDSPDHDHHQEEDPTPKPQKPAVIRIELPVPTLADLTFALVAFIQAVAFGPGRSFKAGKDL